MTNIEIKIVEMKNDDLKKEYINNYINLILCDDLETKKNLREYQKKLYDELRKRHIFASTYKKIKDMNIRSMAEEMKLSRYQ